MTDFVEAGDGFIEIEPYPGWENHDPATPLTPEQIAELEALGVPSDDKQ